MSNASTMVLIMTAGFGIEPPDDVRQALARVQYHEAEAAAAERTVIEWVEATMPPEGVTP